MRLVHPLSGCLCVLCYSWHIMELPLTCICQHAQLKSPISVAPRDGKVLLLTPQVVISNSVSARHAGAAARRGLLGV
jgi:hypothetical protein